MLKSSGVTRYLVFSRPSTYGLFDGFWTRSTRSGVFQQRALVLRLRSVLAKAGVGEVAFRAAPGLSWPFLFWLDSFLVERRVQRLWPIGDAALESNNFAHFWYNWRRAVFEPATPPFRVDPLLGGTLFQPRLLSSLVRRELPRFGSVNLVFGGQGASSVLWDALTSDGVRPAYYFFPQIASALRSHSSVAGSLGVEGLGLRALQSHEPDYMAQVAVLLASAPMAELPEADELLSSSFSTRRSALLTLLPTVYSRQLLGFNECLDIDEFYYWTRPARSRVFTRKWQRRRWPLRSLFSRYPLRRDRLKERYPVRFAFGALRRRYLNALVQRLALRALTRRSLALGAYSQLSVGQRLFGERLDSGRFRFLRRRRDAHIAQGQLLAAQPLAREMRVLLSFFRLRRRWTRFRWFARRRVGLFDVLRHLFSIGKSLYRRSVAARTIFHLSRWDLHDLRSLPFSGRDGQRRSQALYSFTYDALSTFRDRFHSGYVLRYLRSARTAYFRGRRALRHRRFDAMRQLYFRHGRHVRPRQLYRTRRLSPSRVGGRFWYLLRTSGYTQPRYGSALNFTRQTLLRLLSYFSTREPVPEPSTPTFFAPASHSSRRPALLLTWLTTGLGVTHSAQAPALSGVWDFFWRSMWRAAEPRFEVPGLGVSYLRRFMRWGLRYALQGASRIFYRRRYPQYGYAGQVGIWYEGLLQRFLRYSVYDEVLLMIRFLADVLPRVFQRRGLAIFQRFMEWYCWHYTLSAPRPFVQPRRVRRRRRRRSLFYFFPPPRAFVKKRKSVSNRSSQKRTPTSAKAARKASRQKGFRASAKGVSPTKAPTVLLKKRHGPSSRKKVRLLRVKKFKMSRFKQQLKRWSRRSEALVREFWRTWRTRFWTRFQRTRVRHYRHRRGLRMRLGSGLHLFYRMRGVGGSLHFRRRRSLFLTGRRRLQLFFSYNALPLSRWRPYHYFMHSSHLRRHVIGETDSIRNRVWGQDVASRTLLYRQYGHRRRVALWRLRVPNYDLRRRASFYSGYLRYRFDVWFSFAALGFRRWHAVFGLRRIPLPRGAVTFATSPLFRPRRGSTSLVSRAWSAAGFGHVLAPLTRLARYSYCADPEDRVWRESTAHRRAVNLFWDGGRFMRGAINGSRYHYMSWRQTLSYDHEMRRIRRPDKISWWSGEGTRRMRDGRIVGVVRFGAF